MSEKAPKEGFVIDEKLCTACLSCVSVCPMMIYEKAQDGGKKKVRVSGERAHLCMACGHCMAVCTGKALAVPGLGYERDFFELPGKTAGKEELLAALHARRSVRVFKDTPVPREALEELAREISFAPPAFPPHNVELTIVESRAAIERALPAIVAFYDKAIAMLGRRVPRFFMRRAVAPDVFDTMQNHIKPIYELEIPIMKKTGKDVFTYGAPALVIFHAPRAAPCHTENLYIALSFGLVAAHAMGLGATAIGMIPPAVNRDRRVRELFGVPEENEALASMIVGYPRVVFRRGIRRELRSVRWVK